MSRIIDVESAKLTAEEYRVYLLASEHEGHAGEVVRSSARYQVKKNGQGRDGRENFQLISVSR